jgi:hypothetical protein
LWTKKILTNKNEKVSDVNSPVQTQESEMGEGELQVGASRVDTGGKSDESSTNVAASFIWNAPRAQRAYTGSLKVVVTHLWPT